MGSARISHYAGLPKSKGPILTSGFFSLGTDRITSALKLIPPSSWKGARWQDSAKVLWPPSWASRQQESGSEGPETKMHSQGFLWARSRSASALDFGLIGLYFYVSKHFVNTGDGWQCWRKWTESGLQAGRRKWITDLKGGLTDLLERQLHFVMFKGAWGRCTVKGVS